MTGFPSAPLPSTPLPYTPLPYTLVGFDMDGTLLDTSGDLAAAVNHALASAGRPELTVDEIKPMIGGGARHMLAQGMARTGGCDPAELDVLHRRLLDYYEANMTVLTAPYPHALAALDALAAAGATLAVVTNKLERYAAEVLDTLGLTARFATLIGGDTLGPGRGKPEPDPILEMIRRCDGTVATTAFVGDSIYDVKAAQAAGVPVIGCSFGFLDRPAAALGADAVIDGFDELVPALRRLGRR